MQRVLAQLEADAAAELDANVVPVRRRRRGRGGGADSDGEVEDVLPNGMALAVFNEQYDAVAELLLRGVGAAALDRCGVRRQAAPSPADEAHRADARGRAAPTRRRQR